MERYTSQAQGVLEPALGMTETLSRGYVDTKCLLIGLPWEGTGVTARVPRENEVEEDRVIESVNQLIAPDPTVQTANETAYTPRARRVIENSYRKAVRFKAAQIGTEHIPIAMLGEGDHIASRLLNIIGVSIQRLYIDPLAAIGEDASAAEDDLQGARAGKCGNATPTLDSYSRNLIRLTTVGRLDPVIGREQEIQRVVQILSHRTKNNPYLIGEPGVDKTAVVEGLTQVIVFGGVPETIVDKRIVTLDLSGMVAGSKYRSESEERVKKVISEMVESGDMLLFIDEIHTIIGVGGVGGAPDMFNTLKPSLTRGEIQLIGVITINEYHKYIEKGSALERRFQPVAVDEPTEEESVIILKGLRGRYGEHRKVEITGNALEAAVKLSSRYINDRFSPGRAIDLIDEAAPKVCLQNYTKSDKIKVCEAKIDGLEKAEEEAIKKEAYKKAGEIKKKQERLRGEITQAMEKWQKGKGSKELIVNDNEITGVVSGWTRIPVRKLTEGESERLRNLEGILHQRAVGQEEAVTAISKTIRRGRADLKDLKRPIGSFLLLGSTDVGKTELSKALSETMFDTGNALTRVDTSEYVEKYSVFKTIGSPPRYVGYDEEGQFSKKVRRNPYSAVLFDEIEKAHPGVFNILLQVLGDDHITGAQGRKIDFKNTTTVMISSTGVENIASPKRLGFGMVSDTRADYTLMKD